MPDLLIIPAVVLGVIFYAFMVGFCYPKFERALELRCKKCQDEGRGCWEDHSFNAGGCALLWPFVLPLAFGLNRGDPDRLKRKNEALSRRIAQLEKEAGLGG